MIFYPLYLQSSFPLMMMPLLWENNKKDERENREQIIELINTSEY